MYAVVGQWKADRSRTSQQRDGLQRMVIPQVSGTPGFIRGSWAESVSSDSNTTFMVFDSHDNATAFMASVRANSTRQAEVGMELVEQSVVEIVAEAGATEGSRQ